MSKMTKCVGGNGHYAAVVVVTDAHKAIYSASVEPTTLPVMVQIAALRAVRDVLAGPLELSRAALTKPLA